MNLYNLKDAFESIVGTYSCNIALSYRNSKKNLTYKALNHLANQMAQFLLAQDVKKGDIIAIINTKEPLSLAMMIACLKIGAAYTNIDDENPVLRTEKMLQTCQPKLLFIDDEISESLFSSLTNQQLPPIKLSDINLAEFSTNNLPTPSSIHGDTVAYIMFTSGSTGTPKGVAISHNNLLNFIAWSVDKFSITPQDTFANVSPIYFDNSVFDIFSSLFSGATLAPINKSITKNAVMLVKQVEDLRCTIWFSVPSLLIYLNTFKVLTSNTFPDIRAIIFGGEGFPKVTLKKIYDRMKNRVSFINVYGPTEGTCICSSYQVKENDFNDLAGILPLGSINQNFDYKIIDVNEKTVAEGETGELCLLGPNLALGYYNDLSKTKSAFIPNKNQKKYIEIMYRTGDLVYQSKEDNLLYFVSRKDNQIKHMGYRIELDEIEQACLTLHYIDQAITVYKKTHDNYGKIFAYVVSNTDVKSESQVIKDLNSILPNYMIPSDIIFVQELPKNSNGKVDRNAFQLN